jgi:hypothetical protein
MSHYVEYDRIDAMEADGGALRLYRRRGPLGLLRRQQVFHPRGEWLTVMWHPSGKVQVTLADPRRKLLDATTWVGPTTMTDDAASVRYQPDADPPGSGPFGF